MTNKLFFTGIMALLFITSCNETRSRKANGSTKDSSLNPLLVNKTNYDGSNNSSSSSSSGGNSENIDPKAQLKGYNEENKHCQWSVDGKNDFETTDSHLGMHTMCMSSTNNTHLFIQVRDAINDSQVCFVPTHNVAANSVYIGEPRCTMLSEANRIYQINLYKNRPGYSNLPITGIMAMKDKSHFYPPPFYQYVLTPDAYLFCSQFLDQYGDTSYCEAFKSKGEYTFKQF